MAPDGHVIPHLYSAGECGGLSAHLYQGGNNLAECLIFGKIAGQNAAIPKDGNPQYPARKVTSVDTTSGASAHQNNSIKSSSKQEQFSTGSDQYIGTSNSGMGNELVVGVTDKDHQLKKIEILKQSESPDYGVKALKVLPGLMVKANSADVDAYTGATTTSQALTEAVKDALNKMK